MKKVGSTALLALIVVLCPVVAAGQAIGAGESPQQEGLMRATLAGYQSAPGQQFDPGRLTAAEDRAKEARTDAAAAKTSADRANQRISCLSKQVRDPKTGLIKQVMDVRDQTHNLETRTTTLEVKVNNNETGLAATYAKADGAERGVDTLSEFMRSGKNNDPNEFSWLRRLHKGVGDALVGHNILLGWLWVVFIVSVLSLCLGLWNMFYTRPTPVAPVTAVVTSPTISPALSTPHVPAARAAPATPPVVTPARGGAASAPTAPPAPAAGPTI